MHLFRNASIELLIELSLYLLACLFIYVSIYLFICSFVHLFIYLSISSVLHFEVSISEPRLDLGFESQQILTLARRRSIRNFQLLGAKAKARVMPVDFSDALDVKPVL
jgi:uncharacterized protein (DUF58 family)